MENTPQKQSKAVWQNQSGDILFTETLNDCDLPPVGRAISWHGTDYTVKKVLQHFDKGDTIITLAEGSGSAFITIEVRRGKSPKVEKISFWVNKETKVYHNHIWMDGKEYKLVDREAVIKLIENTIV